MRNISDTTASWFVVLGLLGVLALTSFIPAHGDVRRDVQEPAVQRLSLNSGELAEAAANARVPQTNVFPPEELWWTPSEEWNVFTPGAGDVIASAEPVMKKVSGEPARTWFCNLFRLRTPAT